MNWWDDDVRATLIAYGSIAAPALIAFVALRPRPLLPMQRLRFGSWSGASVLFHAMLWFSAILSSYLLFERLDIDGRLLTPIDVHGAVGLGDDPLKAAERLKSLRLSNLSQPFGTLLFLAMSFTLLPILQRSAISTAGMTRSRWRQNLLLGLVAFAIVTPPILAIQVVCTHIWGAEMHPLEVLGRTNGLETAEWIAILVDVSLLAPIWEEWVFRGLLQGWLRRTTYRDHALFVCTAAALVGSLVVLRKASSLDVPISLVAWTAILAAIDLGGLYALYRPLLDYGLALFRRSDLPQLPTEENAVDAWTINLFEAEGQEYLERPWRDFGPRWFRWKIACARWSIVGSAMFFALVHGAWPTPIPLFFLGLALGWLTYRTQSLVPAIVVHGLFNLVSFVTLVIISRPA